MTEKIDIVKMVKEAREKAEVEKAIEIAKRRRYVRSQRNILLARLGGFGN